MLYVAFTQTCDEVDWSNSKKRKKPCALFPCFLHSLTVACFFCSYTALREDVKKQARREKSKSTTENLWQHSAVCHLSFMHELERLFLPRFSGGTEELYRSLLAFRVHTSPCTVAVDGRKIDIGRTLISSCILTGSYLMRKNLSPPGSYGLWSEAGPVKRPFSVTRVWSARCFADPSRPQVCSPSTVFLRRCLGALDLAALGCSVRAHLLKSYL